MLDAEAGDEGVLVLGGEQPLALHLVLGGQAEGEDHRGRAMGFGPLHRAADDSPVADVDAVKKAHCHSRAVGTAQRKRRKLRIDLHECLVLFVSLYEEFFDLEHAAGDL